MVQIPIQAKNNKEEHPSSTRSSIQSFLKKRLYTWLILITILLDFIMMGLLTYNLSDFVVILFHVMDILIQGVFVMDCFLQIYCFRCDFFKDGWKILDLATTIITSVPLRSFSKYSKFIREIRILRVLRAFSHFSGLRSIIDIIGKALPQVGWALLIQLIIFYCYAVVGTMFFGGQFPAWFGSLGCSLYSLFQIMTLESWSMGIARPVIAVFPLAWVYFVTFVIISSFVLMNIVVGVIVNSIQDFSTSELMKCDSDENHVVLWLLLKIKELESELSNVVDEKKEEMKKDNSIVDDIENTPVLILDLSPTVTPFVASVRNPLVLR